MTDVEICNLAISLLGGNPIVTLGDATRQAQTCTKWFATARDEVLGAFPWNFAKDRAILTLPWVSLAGAAITNQGGLIKVTHTGHGLVTGKRVQLRDVQGVTAANASWIVTRLDNNNFTLDGSVFSGAYTNATGRFVQQPLFGWSYQYALPANCLTILRVNGNDGNEDDSDPHDREGAMLLTDADSVYLRYIFRETTTANWPADFCNAFALLLASYLATDLVGTGTGKAGALRQQFDLVVSPKVKTRDAGEGKARTLPQGHDSKVLHARKGFFSH